MTVNTETLVEMYRTLRRAWPLLATVEQDSVPPYFLKMYYPVKYRDTIMRDSQRFGIDPETEVKDQTGRPFKLANGEPIQRLFAV